MHITHLTIKNFRAVEDISFDLSENMNVVCGPNGVGKTTILQALRIIKALLAPRTNTETQQVLISLGAASPHFPQNIFLKGLARDEANKIVIRSVFIITDDELATLDKLKSAFLHAVVAARFGQNFTSPAQLIQFIQSPIGQKAHAEVESEYDKMRAQLGTDFRVYVGVTIDPSTNSILPVEALGGPLIAFLTSNSLHTCHFSRFFPLTERSPWVR